MRGLKDLNRSLAPIEYTVKKKKVITYLLKGNDESTKEFETKSELLKYVNMKGLTLTKNIENNNGVAHY